VRHLVQKLGLELAQMWVRDLAPELALDLVQKLAMD
jgi:hypothetical protein